jgi:hypothetical protein
MALIRFLGVFLFGVCLASCDAASPTDPPVPGEPPDPSQWTQVSALPSTIVDAVVADGSTVYAGSENRVIVSRDAGATWQPVAPLNSGITITALAVKDGRVFAGTLGDGVFEHVDPGSSWTSRSDGLTGSARRVLAFATRGSRLYAGTDGAGVLVLDVSAGSSWAPFRTGMPSNLSWNVGDVVLAGTRLIAGAGGNGSAYLNDEGVGEWREVSYDVVFPGVLRIVFDAETIGPAAQPVVLLGTTTGVYRSIDRGDTWTRFDLASGSISNVSFARTESTAFLALTNARTGTQLFVSDDRGETWRFVVNLPGVFVTDLEVAGERLYAGRLDGLWSLPISATRPTALDTRRE